MPLVPPAPPWAKARPTPHSVFGSSPGRRAAPSARGRSAAGLRVQLLPASLVRDRRRWLPPRLGLVPGELPRLRGLLFLRTRTRKRLYAGLRLRPKQLRLVRLAAHARRAGLSDVADSHFDQAAELAPLDFTVVRAAMPLRGENPFGQEFFDLYGAFREAGSPYHGIPRTTA